MTTKNETESVYRQVSGGLVHQTSTGLPDSIGQVTKPGHIEGTVGVQAHTAFTGVVDPNAEVTQPDYAHGSEGAADPSTGTGPRSPTAEYHRPGHHLSEPGPAYSTSDRGSAFVVCGDKNEFSAHTTGQTSYSSTCDGPMRRTSGEREDIAVGEARNMHHTVAIGSSYTSG